MFKFSKHNCNGYFGCTKCLQPGVTIDKRHIYPFDKKNPKGPVRNDSNYESDLVKMKYEKTPINGIKGECCSIMIDSS